MLNRGGDKLESRIPRKERSSRRDLYPELIARATERSFDAEVEGLFKADHEIFGQPVTVFKVERPELDSVKVYTPTFEAQAAGYVPKMWLEFAGPGIRDGAILEVRDTDTKLVRSELTTEGVRPVALPVRHTWIMVARGVNILRDGILVEPFQDQRAA